jgi:hypothetical protein
MAKNESITGLLAWACKGLLGGVFLTAAVPKILDPKGFAVIIDAYGIVPENTLVPVAIALSTLEVACGIGIFFNWGRSLSLTMIFGLLLLFIGVLSYGLWMGFDIDCGCFGKNEPKHMFFSSLRSALYRDLMLLLPVAYLYWHGWLNQTRMKEIQDGNKERTV